MSSPTVTAIVLCGGESRRFGADKTAADLDGRTVLDNLLDSLPPDWHVTCVGEERPTTRQVTWAREKPPGGGPLAGVAAALAGATHDVAVILGGDMPFAGPTAAHLVEQLVDFGVLSSPGPLDAVAAHDAHGRIQPLLLAAPTATLRKAIPEPAHGIPLMRLLDGLRVASVDPSPGADLDVDTPEDLSVARRRLGP